MGKRSSGPKGVSGAGRRKAEPGEWLGGRFRLPFYITENQPYRPELVLWFEATSTIVVGFKLLRPTEPQEAVATSFFETVANPLVAGTAAPRSIRIADPALAKLLRSRVGERVRVRVAPTPELDAVLSLFGKQVRGKGTEGPSYLEGGRVSADIVERFFRAAASLYRVAPWKIVLDESQILSLEAPDFNRRGACVVIIGAMGENLGFLVLDSVDDYEIMASWPFERGREPEGFPAVPSFSVNFDPRSELPEPMQREIAEHGWEVAGPRAYPYIAALDPDGVPRPLSESDVFFAAAACEALVRFFRRHAAMFSERKPRPVTEEVTLEDLPGKPTLRLSAPHPKACWAS